MGLRIPVVPKCCCCIPLRIGCLIIGYANVVASCIILGVSSWIIYRQHEIVENFKLRPTPGQTLAEIEKEALGTYIFYGYNMVVVLINCLLSVILVIGVHMNNSKLLKCFCYMTCVVFTIGLGLVVVAGMYMGLLIAAGMLKWCFTLLFIAIIVRSRRLEMEEENKPTTMQEMKNLNIVQEVPLMA